MGTKLITSTAGINSLNEIKHIRQLQSNLYQWKFSLRKMPECVLKFELKKAFDPQIRGILNELRKLEEHFDNS